MNNEILDIAQKKLFAKSVDYLGVWNGYNTYAPTYGGRCPALGIPCFILEKDGDIRLTQNREESFSVLDFFHPPSKEKIDLSVLD